MTWCIPDSTTPDGGPMTEPTMGHRQHAIWDVPAQYFSVKTNLTDGSVSISTVPGFGVAGDKNDT